MTHLGHSTRILVLGGTGKVATMLARHWANAPVPGWDICWQGRGTAGAGQVKRGLVKWDLGDDMRSLPRADIVIALWGVCPGSNQPYEANITLGMAALEIGRAVGASRVFLASSIAVYGAVSHSNAMETNTDLMPPGAYGQSKLAMERALDIGPETGGNAPACCILRLANVIGADSLFGAIETGQNVVLDRFASGSGPSRSYVTSGDLARCLQALATCPADRLPPIVNIAGHTPLYMEDLAQAAGATITWREAPATALERVAVDTDMIEKRTGPLAESSDARQAIEAWETLKQSAVVR